MLSKNKFLNWYQLALPSLIAADLVRIVQLVAVRLYTGPVMDLGQIASSPVSILQRVITVSFESSMSIPSLLGVLKSPLIDTSSIKVPLHRSKCMLQTKYGLLNKSLY